MGAVDRVQAMVSGIGFIAVSSRETPEEGDSGRCASSLTLMLFAPAPMPAEKDAPDRAMPFT